MRGILVIISIFFTSTTLFAQWSNDPENPLIICADPAAQSEPELVFDGEESYYVFWLDNRSGLTEIYGQRLDADGNMLWEADGKRIVGNDNPITCLQVAVLEDNTLMLCWSGYSDSVLANIVNADGELVLATHATLAGPTPSIWGASGYELEMMRVGNTCYVTYVLTGFGYDDLYINKISDAGVVEWGYNGLLVWDAGVGSAGNLKLIPDLSGGGYISWEFYGAYLQRFDASGSFLWTEPTLVTACTAGIGGTYAGHPYYGAQNDGAGGLFSAWTSTDRDVYAARIADDGTFVWDELCLPIYTDPSVQEGIALSGSADGQYVSWIDSRPDAPGFYMQKLGLSGEALWSEPVYVEDTNYYIPVLKSTITSDDQVALFYNAAGRFYAQKLDADGNIAWPQPIEVLAGEFQPFYTQFQLLATDDHNVIGVSRTFYTEDIVLFNLNFISGDTVETDTTTTFIHTPVGHEVLVFPNPATDILQLELPEGNDYLVCIYDVQGSMQLSTRTQGKSEIAVDGLAPGIYLLQATNKQGEMYATQFVKHE